MVNGVKGSVNSGDHCHVDMEDDPPPYSPPGSESVFVTFGGNSSVVEMQPAKPELGDGCFQEIREVFGELGSQLKENLDYIRKEHPKKLLGVGLIGAAGLAFLTGGSPVTALGMPFSSVGRGGANPLLPNQTPVTTAGPNLDPYDGMTSTQVEAVTAHVTQAPTYKYTENDIPDWAKDGFNEQHENEISKLSSAERRELAGQEDHIGYYEILLKKGIGNGPYYIHQVGIENNMEQKHSGWGSDFKKLMNELTGKAQNHIRGMMANPSSTTTPQSQVGPSEISRSTVRQRAARPETTPQRTTDTAEAGSSQTTTLVPLGRKHTSKTLNPNP